MTGQQSVHETATPAITVADCIGGTELSEPRLRPDARALGFIRSAQGRSVFVVEQLPDPAREAVVGERSEIELLPAPHTGRGLGGGCWTWTPDGSGIVYAAVDGDLWWVDCVANGSVSGRDAPTRLTQHGPDRSAQAPAMARFGRAIAYVVDQAEVWVTYLGAVSGGGRSRRLDDGTADFCFDPVLGPATVLAETASDARVAAGEACPALDVVWQAWNVPDMAWDRSRLERVALEGSGRAGGCGAPRHATSAQQPSFAQDGTLLAVRDNDGWNNVWIGDRAVAAEPFEHAGPGWGLGQRSYALSPDGSSVVFTRNEAGFGRLCVADVTGGEVREIGRGVHGQLSWRGRYVAALRTGARTPTEVVVYDMAVPQPTRTVVATVAAQRWAATLVEPEAVTFPAADGSVIHARIYRLDIESAGPPRVLCWLHGGPTDQWQVTFMPRVAYWLRRGWNVIVPDHRGSTGHGRAYQQALRGRWGELDVSDTVDSILYAHSAGLGSSDTTVLIGGSAGGFTVLGTLRAAPHLVAAAVVAYPVSDLADLAERSHRFERHYTDTLVGDFCTTAGRALARDRSPLWFADRIATPLLVFHGTDDPVVPVQQSVSLCERIRAAGGEVEMCLYEGEGHGFRQAANQLDEYRRTAAFLGRHVAVAHGYRRLGHPHNTIGPAMTDWNPEDPDATRVYYDLNKWTFDQQAELASAMADAEIPHGWIEGELVVPEADEQRTDLVIADVEGRLGIVTSDDVDDLDADSSGEAVFDADGEFEESQVPELDAATPSTEYDLDEWEDSERILLTHALADARIACRWEAAVLLVSTVDEEVVDALLDDIESGEYVDLRSGAAAPDDGAPAGLLTTFFLAGARLRKDPLDADGLEQLLAATDVAEADSPPFGVQPRLWAQTCEAADRVADALTVDGGPDLNDVMDAAAALHDLLRPHV